MSEKFSSGTINHKQTLTVTARASVYNGHFLGPETLTPITERLAAELSLPVFLTRRGFEQTTFRLRGQRCNPLCHRRDQINF